MENIEENKLIADFMGIPKHDCSTPNCYEFGSRVFYSAEKMKYNSSWDWLMPVVVKIESIDSVIIDIHREATSIKHYGTGNFRDYNDISWNQESKIDHVYNGVVKFIKWYNSQES